MAAGALIILIAVCAAMIAANVCFKRSRPIEPSDDLLGDLPNVPRLTNPVRVDALHRSGDTL